MGFQFILVALGIVSILTTLTVQGIKYVLDTANANYSSNILAVIVSIVLSGVGVVLFCLYTNEPFTVQIGVEAVVLMYLSFLVSTNGYDKVMQTIKQLKDRKDV